MKSVKKIRIGTKIYIFKYIRDGNGKLRGQLKDVKCNRGRCNSSYTNDQMSAAAQCSASVYISAIDAKLRNDLISFVVGSSSSA